MTRRRWVAPLADLVCIVTFILAGAGRHQIDEGTGWFFTVLWPIAVGWYAAALVLRLYRSADRWPLRLVGTVALGTAVMIVLRGGFTDRPWVSVFTLIYVVWMLATAFGWRAIVRAVTSRRSAPATPATSSRRP
jgi:thiol:disulfide interchange protein